MCVLANGIMVEAVIGEGGKRYLLMMACPELGTRGELISISTLYNGTTLALDNRITILVLTRPNTVSGFQTLI